MKALMKTFLAAAFLVSTGAVLAQGAGFGPGKGGPGNFGPGGQRGMQGGMQGMPMVQNVVRGLRRLDLSDEQIENVQAVMQNLRTEAGPVRDEMWASHMQLRELIKADDYDENAVAALAAKEGELAAERIMMASRALSEVYGYLTAEQRAELDEMYAQRMVRRAERQSGRRNW